jgi:hypothetical protein
VWLRKNLLGALEKARSFQSHDAGLNIHAAERIAELALSAVNGEAKR